MDGLQMKKKQALPKTIPWEPYKGATSAHCKSTIPVTLPPLIPYRISSPSKMKGSKSTSALSSTASCPLEKKGPEFVNTLVENGTSKLLKSTDNKEVPSQKLDANLGMVEQLRQELWAERQLTAELKKLLVASLGDDLTCHIQALSEDKVRLASKMNSFAVQSSVDHDRAEDLQIMSDMWRCKFLAMSVRADELTTQLARLLAHLKNEHQVLEDIVNAAQCLPPGAIPVNVLKTAESVLSIDITKFCGRTPCDEKIHRPSPITSNITVSCCKNCASHEIKLL